MTQQNIDIKDLSLLNTVSDNDRILMTQESEGHSAAALSVEKLKELISEENNRFFNSLNDISTTKLKDTYGYILKQHTIDASTLDPNTYYPVVMTIGALPNVRIEVIVSLSSGTMPVWSTHPRGFSVRKIWEVNGWGWGANPVNRIIFSSDYAFANADPVRGISQMTYGSHEVVYVRGGGKYNFRISHNITPVLITTSFTNNSQTVTSTTTAPAAIVRNNAYITDNVSSASRLQTAGSNVNWSSAGNITGNGLYYYSDTSTAGRAFNYGSIFQFSNTANPIPGTSQHWITQILSSIDGHLNVRWRTNTGGWTEVQRIVTSSNIGNYAFPISGGTLNGSLNVTGNIASTGEITAYSTSDKRLKTNLKTLSGSSLLRLTNVYSYDWTDEGMGLRAQKQRHDEGFIAQEIEEIAPHFVTHNMWGKGFMGVDKTRFIPHLVSGWNEHEDEINSLKTRIEDLEGELYGCRKIKNSHLHISVPSLFFRCYSAIKSFFKR